VRSEYAHAFEGSGYWIEGAYRLSQVHVWEKAMRRTEFVARGQQFFVGAIGADAEDALGLPGVNTREADFGVNYFLRDGMKGIFSYGRQFSSAGNFNQWSFGIAYRFLIPLGPDGRFAGGKMKSSLLWKALAAFGTLVSYVLSFWGSPSARERSVGSGGSQCC